MYKLNVIGYLPGYSGNFGHTFTAEYPERVSISFDNIETDTNAKYNVLCQCEPPTLYRDFYGMVEKNYTKFDLILAYDPRLLEFPNSQEFCPVGTWVDNLPLNKQNQITFLMSSKIWSSEHRMRFMIMHKYGNHKTINNFQFYWHRNPPMVVSKNPFFINAKFHIACENQVMPNMYSEKLLDCFKTKTVPIYYGCTNINKYFNPKGILQFNTFEQFESIVNNLNDSTYDDMKPYIEENYELCRPYWENSIHRRIEDQIYQKFFI